MPAAKAQEAALSPNPVREDRAPVCIFNVWADILLSWKQKLFMG